MKTHYNLIIDSKKLFVIEAQTDVAQLLATVIFYFGNSAKIKWKIEIDAPVILKLKRVMRYKKESFIEFTPLFFDVIKDIKYSLSPKYKKQFYLFATYKREIIVVKSPWNVALTRALCLFIPQFKKFIFKAKLNEAEQDFLDKKVKNGEYIDFIDVIKTEREKAVGALLEEYRLRGQIK